MTHTGDEQTSTATTTPGSDTPTAPANTAAGPGASGPTFATESASGRLSPIAAATTDPADGPAPGSLQLSEGVLMGVCLALGMGVGLFLSMLGFGALFLALGIVGGGVLGVLGEIQNNLGLLDRMRDWLRTTMKKAFEPAPPKPAAPAPVPVVETVTEEKKPAEEQPADEPKAEVQPADEPKAEVQPADEPKAEDKPADEPKAEEKPADDGNDDGEKKQDS